MVNFEPRLLEYWQNLDLTRLKMEQNRDQKPFAFFDGPITANNPRGVHHAGGRTYKDVVQRFRHMQGYDLRFQNGFDTQGLWVEVEVEKSLDFNSKGDIENYGVDNFAEACKNRVNKYADVITEQSKRLGQLMDWENSYFTHNDQNVEAIWHFLRTCHERGWLYKGLQPMPWCWRCGTSLSTHEQSDSYKEVSHLSPYLKLKVENSSDLYLLVWTTTPWTLPANTAVAVHPDYTYGVFDTGNEKLVAGLWLKDSLLQRYEVTKTLKGEELRDLTYLPLFEELDNVSSKQRPVLCWDEVSDEEGTGLVHVAPGCGVEDFEFSKQLQEDNNLPLDVVSPLDEDGLYTNGFGKFSRLHYKKVNQLVLGELQNNGLLFTYESYRHRYPHCWRCKEELVYRTTSEWFLAVDELRDPMKKVAQTVTWKPAYVGSLFQDWLSNMGDWCISRKRYWGLPLPFYECECGSLNVPGSKKELFDRAVGDTSQVKELHLPWVDKVAVRCQQCNQPVDRVSDVGDCWLDAGIVPFSTLNYFTESDYWEKWFPAEFVCEMREQVRLWFYATMFMSVTLVGKSPYKTVVAYERVNDADNKPMHKSTGNAVQFDTAADQLGADTLRMMYLEQTPSRDMRFDPETGKFYQRYLLTVWNVLRLFNDVAELEEFQYDATTLDKPSKLLNQWVLSRLSHLRDSFTSNLENYDFVSTVKLLVEFVDDLSNWYVRRSKEMLWQKHDTNAKNETLNTYYYALHTLSVLLAPLVPFFSELMYQVLSHYREKPLVSVHLEEWPALLHYDNSKLEEDMDLLRSCVKLGHKLRSKNNLRVRQPLSTTYVWARQDLSSLERFVDVLKSELNVKSVEFLDDVSDKVKYSLQPNYKLLGPKFGSRVKQVASLLQKVPSEDVSSWLQSEEPLVLDKDNDFVVSSNEVEVRTEPVDGLQVVSEGDLMVLLDMNLTTELRQEGVVRDFVRHLQVKRKELDLGLETEVTLFVGGSRNLWNQLTDYMDYMAEQSQLKETVFVPDARYEESFTSDNLQLTYVLRE